MTDELREEYVYFEAYYLYDDYYNIGMITAFKDIGTTDGKLLLYLGADGQYDFAAQFVRR